MATDAILADLWHVFTARPRLVGTTGEGLFWNNLGPGGDPWDPEDLPWVVPDQAQMNALESTSTMASGGRWQVGGGSGGVRVTIQSHIIPSTDITTEVAFAARVYKPYKSVGLIPNVQSWCGGRVYQSVIMACSFDLFAQNVSLPEAVVMSILDRESYFQQMFKRFTRMWSDALVKGTKLRYYHPTWMGNCVQAAEEYDQEYSDSARTGLFQRVPTDTIALMLGISDLTNDSGMEAFGMTPRVLRVVTGGGAQQLIDAFPVPSILLKSDVQRSVRHIMSQGSVVPHMPNEQLMTVGETGADAWEVPCCFLSPTEGVGWATVNENLGVLGGQGFVDVKEYRFSTPPSSVGFNTIVGVAGDKRLLGMTGHRQAFLSKGIFPDMQVTLGSNMTIPVDANLGEATMTDALFDGVDAFRL